MQGIGGGNAAQAQQKPGRRLLQVMGRRLQALEGNRLFVWIDQQPHGLVRHGGRQLARAQRSLDGVLLGLALLLLECADPGCLQSLRGGRPIDTPAFLIEMHRRPVQGQDEACLIHRPARRAKDFSRKGGRGEVFCGCAVPEKVGLQALGHLLGRLQERLCCRLLKTHQHLIGLELESPPRDQADLQARVRLAQHGCRLECTRLLKEDIHQRILSPPEMTTRPADAHGCH